MTSIIVIPTYNERDNIYPLTKQIMNVGKDIRILFIDDNSPDGTGQIAEDLAKSYDQIHVIHRRKKLGLGTAYVAGFKYALEQGVDYVIQMDADLQHDPEYIPFLLEKIRDFDLVVASRYLIRTPGHLSLRVLASILANRYVQLLTGLHVSDCLSGFKCFRKELLEDIDLDKFISKGFIFQADFLYRAYKKGYKIEEIPIRLCPRRSGRSKLSMRIVLEMVLKVPLFHFRL